MPSPSLVHTELAERYLKRASLFWKFSRDAKFAKWQREARSASWRNLVWNWSDLGISAEARDAAERLGFVPSEVFAHPEVIQRTPDLQKYYRLLACLPAKGLAQIRIKGAKQDRLLNICILLSDIDKVFELLPIFKQLDKRQEFLEEFFKFSLRERIG